MQFRYWNLNSIEEKYVNTKELLTVQHLLLLLSSVGITAKNMLYNLNYEIKLFKFPLKSLF